MAAVLLRRGPGLCVRCIHRELCRVVWRPQAALFSSKPSDRKPPRKTHIKKAKPQPALDVNKLLEQLFSQKRPDTAPPAGKARPAQASSMSTKPRASSSSSSVKVPTSSVPPAASSLPKENIAPVSTESESASPTKPKTSFSSETPQQSSQVFTADAVSNVTVATTTNSSTTPAPVAPPKCQTSAETVESKAAAEPALSSSSTYMIKTNVETSSSAAVAIEPIIETAIESPVEASPGPDPINPTVDAAAEEVQTKSIDSGAVDASQTTTVKPLIETAIESPVEASPPTVEAQETSTAVVDGPVEPIVDAAAEEVHTKSIDSGVVATVEPLIETTIEPSVEASISALETAEAQVEALAEEVRTKNKDIGEINLLHTANEEPLIETAVEASVESNTSALGMLESRAAVPESTIKPTIDTEADTAAQTLQPSSTDSAPVNLSTKEEPLIETTVEASVETSRSPLESRAAVAEAVEITVDSSAKEVRTSNSTDSRAIDFTQTSKAQPIIEITVESQVDTKPPPVEALETRAAAVVGGPVEPIVDAAAEEVHTKSIDSGGIDFTQTAKVEPLIETTIEPSVETSTTDLEIPESRAAVAGQAVETTVDAPGNEVRTNSTDSGVIDFTQTAKVEPLIETTVESSVEAMRSTLAAVSESIVEEVNTKSIESEVIDFTQTAKLESLTETTIESRAAVAEGPVEPKVETGVEESLSHAALIQTVQESAALPLINEVESTVESSSGNVVVEVAEEMNLEAVTLNLAKVLVKSLKTDELLLAKSDLDEKAEKRLQELLVQTGVGAELKAATETENSTETLTEILSKWETLSEDLHELEGETGMLVKEILCHVPAVLSETSTSVEKSSKEDEAMTLESITLADVQTEVRSLECEALQETRDALQNKADGLAKEEKMEVKMEKEDVADLEGTIEAEMLALDSISEATDALEAEASVFLESMFGSEQGLTQPLGALLIERKEGETIVQEAEKESKEQDGSVLEAMSLESVTLAEIEASFGTLESESLNETSAYFEEEAEILAGEKTVAVEDGVAFEEMTEALTVESWSLPEADDLSEALQTDELMEELLFSIPGHAEESRTGQEVVRENNLDDLDPVQRLFLEKIREYDNMSRLSGEPVEMDPDYEKSLSEETAKLQRLYGGGDLSSFPQFTFTEPTMDQDSK
ncbi:citron rho-interacting kinase [Scomber scombrus]|uniref:ATP synthase peripheral stalk subunit F6, mitochondrial n=1 Tax=Scomber scombrus TaxID=13677 RepID=A0AAV1PZU5_SCOSC